MKNDTRNLQPVTHTHTCHDEVTSRHRMTVLIAVWLCAFPISVFAEISETKTVQAVESSQGNTTPMNSEDSNGDNKSLTNVEKPRGQLLYDNHCHVCHESNVHIRANRKARSKKDIVYWVNRWSEHLKLKWSATDKEDVANYLNVTYYHYNEDVID